MSAKRFEICYCGSGEESVVKVINFLILRKYSFNVRYYSVSSELYCCEVTVLNWNDGNLDIEDMLR